MLQDQEDSDGQLWHTDGGSAPWRHVRRHEGGIRGADDDTADVPGQQRHRLRRHHRLTCRTDKGSPVCRHIALSCIMATATILSAGLALPRWCHKAESDRHKRL